MKELLEKLATEGGMIICTSVMDDEMIRQSKASNRLWVDENGIGFSWEPNRLLPTTEEEVRIFEQYYPLPVETPPLDFDELWRRIEEAKRREEIELKGKEAEEFIRKADENVRLMRQRRCKNHVWRKDYLNGGKKCQVCGKAKEEPTINKDVEE